jgi:hypothetical protein
MGLTGGDSLDGVLRRVPGRADDAANRSDIVGRRHEKLPLEELCLVGRWTGALRPHVGTQMVMVAASRQEQGARIAPHGLVEAERAVVAVRRRARREPPSHRHELLSPPWGCDHSRGVSLPEIRVECRSAARQRPSM